MIVTSLLEAEEVSKHELSALYTQRWQIELDLRSIKSVMQRDVLRCLTPDAASPASRSVDSVKKQTRIRGSNRPQVELQLW